jgi:7,8-dihydropterin-6-yl-methyl-4-(beta-D-ribofuranosyl)aminobenzene 5'-phosphate synthase
MHRLIPRFYGAQRRWSTALAAAIVLVVTAATVQLACAQGKPAAKPPAQLRAVKVTVLSTMLVGTAAGFGEWGFSGLVEADGHRILVDTGSHPETVLENARELRIDLSDITEAIITHNHWDHVEGLVAMRRELMRKNPAALSVIHVAKGIFYPRPSRGGEGNPMIEIRKEYEATGGKFIEHTTGDEIFPGAWLTGPVPRKTQEHWDGGRMQAPEGMIEDTVPEDTTLVLNTPQGLVVVAGCAHAGIINILAYAAQHFPGQPFNAVIGGLHLFPATDEQLNWTADKIKEYKVANLLGAHCTGIEAVFRIRQRAGLTRQTAVVGTVGSTFVLGEGIRTGILAK